MPNRIRAKSSAVRLTPTPALFDILQALYRLLDRTDLILPSRLVITSGSEGHPGDGVHSRTSRHYSGEALDIRTHNFDSPVSRHVFASTLQATLGPQFTVLLEAEGTPREHVHIQPIKGSVYR